MMKRIKINMYARLDTNIKLYCFITLSIIVAIFTTYIVILQRGLSFDGAFHAQAALNLYKGKGFNLDYGIKPYIQIGLPFQIVNGLFLYLFGRTFLAGNMANILFYWLFFSFCIFLSNKFKSILLLLSFIGISFLPGFKLYAFGGYGELPSLIYALIGIYVLFRNCKKDKTLLFGSLMLSFAITTKLIMSVLIIPLILWWVIPLKKESISILLKILSLTFSFSFILFMFQWYDFTSPSTIIILLKGIHKQATYNPYSTYAERLLSFMKEYMKFAGFDGLGLIKMLLIILLGSVSIIEHIFERQRTVGNNLITSFSGFLSFLAMFYFLAWFLFWEKNWYRRVFNVDVMLLLSLGIFWHRYSSKYNIGKLKKILKYFSVTSLIILVICNGYLQISQANFKNTSSEMETILKNGLLLLPENWEGFGYGWWQAPRWSYISGRKFHDLLTYPALYYKLVKGVPCYVFFEPDNIQDLPSLEYINNTYDVRLIFEWGGFKIGEIVDFNKKNALYVEEIDFSKDSFSRSIKGFWNWERGFRHSRVEAAVFLNNSAGFSYIQLYFRVHQGLKNVNLKAFVLPTNSSIGYLYDVQLKPGNNNIFIKLPSNSRGLITLYLFHIGKIEKVGVDERLLGITLLKVKLTNTVNEESNTIVTRPTLIFVNNASLLGKVINEATHIFCLNITHYGRHRVRLPSLYPVSNLAQLLKEL